MFKGFLYRHMHRLSFGLWFSIAEDDTSSECPLDPNEEAMCNTVQDMIYSNRRMRVEEIAKAL